MDKPMFSDYDDSMSLQRASYEHRARLEREMYAQRFRNERRQHTTMLVLLIVLFNVAMVIIRRM